MNLLGAFIRRDLAIARSYRAPFVFDFVFGFLQLSVFYFLSRTFEDIPSDQLDGAPDYFAFAAVGIVIALVIEASIQGVAERVREGQLTGSLEALLSQPVGPFQLCVGFVSFPASFAVLRGLVYLFIAALLLGLQLGEADWVGLLIILITSIGAIASIGVLTGAALMRFKRGEALAGALVFAMTIVSGSVFPISELPEGLASIGEILPLRYAFDGARDALFTGSGWGDDALKLCAFAVVALPLSLAVFARSIEWARADGSINEY